MAFGLVVGCRLSVVCCRCPLSVVTITSAFVIIGNLTQKFKEKIATPANIYRNFTFFGMVFSMMLSCCCCTNVICMSAGISVVLSGWRLSKSLGFFKYFFGIILVKNVVIKDSYIYYCCSCCWSYCIYYYLSCSHEKSPFPLASFRNIFCVYTINREAEEASQMKNY